MGGSPSPFAIRLESQDPHLRIHAVKVYVRDQDRSLQFYVERLGFEVAFDARLQSGQRWVAVSPPDGTAVLTLIEPDPDSEEYKLIGRSTRIVFVTNDVAAKYREWTQRGVRFRYTPRLRRVRYEQPLSPHPNGPAAPAAALWGGVFTRFEDIDRNIFELVSFDEVSHAVEAQRRAMAEKLEFERRAAQELEIARRVQARLFPQTLPKLRTLEYTGACIQARQVGGDYYDFLNLGQQRLGLVIGDIAGKGIAAALLMANLQANLRSQCAIASDEPQRFLRSVNQSFCENTSDAAYATLFFAEYDDHTQRLRYVNCGHLPGLLLRSDNSIERLDSTSTVLGLFKEWDCSVGECQLSEGDTLAVYTDGITESFNQAEEEFGEQRLIERLIRNRELPPDELVASIVADVQQFSPDEQHDDITLIIARCNSA
jgi:serine phosphatase RsbU (regulator of sigma subunit)/catechol 2,3-dioxygenase-like lactoylglutathione lyase family enzyme